MFEADLKELLTEGLAAGFAGQTQFETVKEGPVTYKVSTFVSSTGGVYRDKWTGGKSGGGHEVAIIGDRAIFRSYSGGTIKDDQLAELGVDHKAVMDYLISKILELGNKTRLDDDCIVGPDGEWQYTYRVMRVEEDLSKIFAREVIAYKNRLVFLHDFSICPLR